MRCSAPRTGVRFLADVRSRPTRLPVSRAARGRRACIASRRRSNARANPHPATHVHRNRAPTTALRPVACSPKPEAFPRDAIGNLRRNVQFDAIQIESAPARIRPDTSHDLIYAYDASRPHAPRCVGNRLVDYDLDGNQRHWEHRPDTCPGTEPFEGERTNVWDEEDRLTRLTDDNADMEFRYDADGERTHRISMGHGRHDVTAYISRFHTVRNEQFAMNHVFAGSERVATVMFNVPPAGGPGCDPTTGRTCVITHLPPGGGPPGTIGSPRTTLWYHTDHLQSTNYVTDARGRQTEHLEYFPFGEQWVEEQSGASSDTVPYRFTGHDWDSESRLYYAGARYYDPRQGQWLGADPAFGSAMRGEPGGRIFRPSSLASTAYVANRPTRSIDPNGAAECDECGPVNRPAEPPDAAELERMRSQAPVPMRETPASVEPGGVAVVVGAFVLPISAPVGAGLIAFGAITLNPNPGHGPASAQQAAEAAPRRSTNQDLDTVAAAVAPTFAARILGGAFNALWGARVPSSAMAPIRELPAPRQVAAAWGAGRYQHGGLMNTIEHIMYRHAANSGFAGVSRYAPGTTARQIMGYVDEALRYGQATTTGPGTISVIHNFGRALGTNIAGLPSRTLQVWIRNGVIRTAYLR